MKLSGNRRGGRHAASGRASHDIEGQNAELKARKRKRRIRIVAVLLLLIVALLVSAFVYVKMMAKPPETKPPIVKPGITQPDGGVDAEGKPIGSTIDRVNDKYTFIILGTDDGNGNTDVMMVATLDVGEHTLNVVNIPRDTLVNVSWKTKKANTLYSHTDSFEAMIEKVEDITGYPIDFYVLVDMNAFIKLVDAVDGIDFYVDRKLYYNDPYQNLSINYPVGQYHLSGKQALEVVRCRSFAQGDIERINTQQKLLMSAAEQVIERKSSINVFEIANIFISNVETDLKLANISWFAQEFFKLDMENISFQTLPANYFDSIGYCTIYVDEWLELINEKMNPLSEPVTAEMLSIYTRGGEGSTKALYVTDGNYASSSVWGSSSGSSGNSGSSGGSSTPSPSPTPSSPPPESTESPDPTPSDTGTVTDPGTVESPPVDTDPVESPPVETDPVDTPPPTGDPETPVDTGPVDTPPPSQDPVPSDTGGSEVTDDPPPSVVG